MGPDSRLGDSRPGTTETTKEGDGAGLKGQWEELEGAQEGAGLLGFPGGGRRAAGPRRAQHHSPISAEMSLLYYSLWRLHCFYKNHSVPISVTT